MIKNCKQCNRVFHKVSTESRSYWQLKRFCSRQCVGKSTVGKKQSAVTKSKRSVSLRKFYANPENRKKLSVIRKQQWAMDFQGATGKKWKKTEEQIKNKMGAKNPAWKGGITPENTKIRNSKEYADWRVAVFARDKYTCQECGSSGVELNADHIKPFAYYPELRLVLSNGRTLCVPCHRKTDTFAGRAKLTMSKTL